MRKHAGIRVSAILFLLGSSLLAAAFHEGDHGEGPMDRTFKIDKTGAVNIGADVKIGRLVVKKGKYMLVHRTEEQRHVFVLTEINKKKEPGQLTAIQIDGRFFPMPAAVKRSAITAKEQRDHRYEVTTIQIVGENGDHVFAANAGDSNASR